MECFIEKLKKLKESSIEAVETLNNFGSFKEYMHIKREIEDELLNIIKKAKEADGPQLVLVCGGVGDGKSHLISYLKKKNPDLFGEVFNFHNDATESLKPTMTAMETLNIVLDPYQDENLEKKNNQKLIVAINLGTMNNFINSKYSFNYKKLNKYIEHNKILENMFCLNEENNELYSGFHFINFSDYHLYSLSEKGVKSDYFDKLIDKIIGENEKNPFYSSYKKNCIDCNNSNICPVKYNYEFLLDKNRKENLVNLLIEMMVKYKTIISTRSFYNFIYEIIVAQQIDSIPLNQIKNKIKEFKTEDIINALIKTIIFEHRQTDKIFKDLSNLDPLKIRKKELDEIVIKFNTRTNMEELLKEYGIKDKNRFLYNLVLKKDWNNSLTKYILRSIEFIRKKEDTLYQEYLRNLYYINTSPKQARRAHELVKNGIYNWNGKSKNKNEINIFPGKKQLKYKVSKNMKLNLVMEKEKKSKENLIKFFSDIMVSFIVGEKTFKFEVDYFLFELLLKIEKGYKPNKKDYSNFIKFSNEVNLLTKCNIGEEKILIEDRLNDFKFTLEYDEYGDLIIEC
jgi:DNA phosphorothioation-dependent restriction protein DptF